MYFAAPQYLYLLLVPFLLMGLSVLGYVRRRRQQRRFADVPLLAALKPEASTMHRIVRNGLILAALALVIVALARPCIERQDDMPQEEKGIECMLVVDISNSMLAKDVRPSRLDFAKITLERIIDRLGASKVGIVVFAGGAYTQLPITTDKVMAKALLRECDPSLISRQGTNIAEALTRAGSAFSSRQEIGQAIILVTDGENHDGDAIAKAKELASNGIKLFTIPIGSAQGAQITDSEGNQLRDSEGHPVVTRCNPDFCLRLAEEGKGAMLTGRGVAELAGQAIQELETLPHAAIATAHNNTEELYGWPVCMAVLLLVVAQFVLLRRNRFLQSLKLFDR